MIYIYILLIINTTLLYANPTINNNIYNKHKNNKISVTILTNEINKGFGFLAEDEQEDNIYKIIKNDLYNSGYFKINNKKDKNINYILNLNIMNDDEKYQVKYKLLYNSKTIISGSVNGKVNQIRDISHYIADRCFEEIKGIKGSFSSKLLYVTYEEVKNNKNNDTPNYKYQLNYSDYDGYRNFTILKSFEPIISPSFSPDNNNVVYVSFEKKTPYIYIQNIKTGNREQITYFDGINSAPTFSKDGNQLAFVLSIDGNPEIYMMNLQTKQLIRLTKNMAIDTEPFFGKNGNIYFSSDRSGTSQIYKLDNNLNIFRITFLGHDNSNPKVFNEKILVMVNRPKNYNPLHPFQIAVQNLLNGNFKIITDNGFNESPTISPNGTMIIYIHNHTHVKLVSMFGNVNISLPIKGNIGYIAWSK